ncbi:MAG: LysM peptidoglycan-binding domain-containing protein [Proteiniphilum sp.]|jgi:LysM repeat protein|nr:LysM peptidoglycan-binding domain-containing protein [Proteiniphilum sp.]MDD2938901.1 LysM peptidoglycan-binding domain-containing protein [Proteiniphilum sp.]MDD3780151.1 LysM peptidoglycan-binding domain-containing protein [Proteiniphilum sp.]MDD4453430.1 LysM peptidoglycan-binding domain-containing protein [Proteiniphilum sp.]
MRNIFFLTPVFILMFLLHNGFQPLQAQDSSYETVTLNGQRYFKYKVKSGEGLYAISRMFSTPIAEIIRHNPSSNAGLKNGQELLIPVNNDNSWRSSSPDSSQTDPAESVDQNSTFQHTVSKGETLYSISNMYHTTVAEINRYNPGASEGIAVGQLLTIPQRRVISEEKEENYRFHTILPKETLYSVSKTYSLKPEDVMLANPGLSAETFQIGKTIRIPFFESYEVIAPYEHQTKNITHQVQKKETLYSIARNYQVEASEIERLNPKISDGLKANMELIIPVKRSLLEKDARTQENEANRLLTQYLPSSKVDVMRVGLLLPFLDETGRGHLRLQEYYEGFLLAVEEMKNNGVNLELFVFEIGKGDDTGKLKSLLETIEMRSLNLVIGGVNDAQIRLISDFSRANNIKYVVPFSQSNGEVLNNGNIFQVNPISSATLTKASSVFVETFRNANIIFATGGQNDKKEFTAELQKMLRENGLSYQTISLTESTNSAIIPLLSSGKENVILPTSADSNTLRQLIYELKEVRETDSLTAIRLFGYPEWQTYTDQVADYHLFGTYIYTPFFIDKANPRTEAFTRNFNKWYGRNLMDTHPSYGLWGYDTGLFFMTALNRYGTRFEQDIASIRINSLQFAFHFERVSNWGGFINSGLYFIYYDTNGRINQTDRSR